MEFSPPFGTRQTSKVLRRCSRTRANRVNSRWWSDPRSPFPFPPDPPPTSIDSAGPAGLCRCICGVGWHPFCPWFLHLHTPSTESHCGDSETDWYDLGFKCTHVHSELNQVTEPVQQNQLNLTKLILVYISTSLPADLLSAFVTACFKGSVREGGAIWFSPCGRTRLTISCGTQTYIHTAEETLCSYRTWL